MMHWAYFLDRLRWIKEGAGTLLDSFVLGLSSGMGMGHGRGALPTLVSGGSALGLVHRGPLKLKEQAPLASLWHTMLDRAGVPVDGRFQDSRGLIKELIRS